MPGKRSKRPRDPYQTDFSRDPLIITTILWAMNKVGLDPNGLRAWDPGAGLGHLVRLNGHGLRVVGTDINAWKGADSGLHVGPEWDVMKLRSGGWIDRLVAALDVIVVNPPYDDPRCALMLRHLLNLAPKQWLFVIVPGFWIQAKGRFTKRHGDPRSDVLNGSRFHAQVPFGDRLFWSEPGPDGFQDNDPEKDHSLLVFRPAAHPLALAKAPPEIWLDRPRRRNRDREPWMKVRSVSQKPQVVELHVIKGGKL